MTDNLAQLSPAAQAVDDAAHAAWETTDDPRSIAVVVLRATAEQVVLPKYQYADWQMAHLIMEEFQNIAAELEEVQP